MINPREALTQKINEVRAMQQQMRQLTERINLLDTQKIKDVIDQQGFPRADLNFGDLAEYKNLKRRFNQINNDHLKLMKQVEKGLFDHHNELRQDPTVQQQANIYVQNKAKEPTKINQKIEQKQITIKQEKQYKIQYLTPFAKISSVQEGSPAQKAGIKAGDLISQIGSITIYEPDSIKSIPKVVKQGVSLKIVVMRLAPQQPQSKVFNVRGEQRIRVDLELVPKKWDGRGLIGCKIDPL